MNTNIEHVLVAGATGGVGAFVVAQLVSARYAVRALARRPARARAKLGDRVEILEGDTLRRDTLRVALEGIEYVICATGSRVPVGPDSPEHVDYEGVRNLAEAARATGVRQLVLVSSLSVTNPNHPLNAFANVLTWKLRGEDALRASGTAYTIVRPGGLADDAGGQRQLRFDQGDRLGSGRISRTDVATVCVQALGRASAFGVTFEVIESEQVGPNDWTALFGQLRPDAGYVPQPPGL